MAADNASERQWSPDDGWVRPQQTYDILAEAFWLLSGSLLVAGGATLALNAAFDGLFLRVYAGFVIFFLGYRTSQFGLHEHENDSSLIGSLTTTTNNINPRDVAMILLGGAAISYGFIVLAESLVIADIIPAAVGGAMILGGYMVAHLATNNTLI